MGHITRAMLGTTQIWGSWTWSASPRRSPRMLSERSGSWLHTKTQVVTYGKTVWHDNSRIHKCSSQWRFLYISMATLEVDIVHETPCSAAPTWEVLCLQVTSKNPWNLIGGIQQRYSTRREATGPGMALQMTETPIEARKSGGNLEGHHPTGASWWLEWIFEFWAFVLFPRPLCLYNTCPKSRTAVYKHTCSTLENCSSRNNLQLEDCVWPISDVESYLRPQDTLLI